MGPQQPQHGKGGGEAQAQPAAPAQDQAQARSQDGSQRGQHQLLQKQAPIGGFPVRAHAAHGAQLPPPGLHL